MNCEEKERLAKEYQAATAEFAEAVGLLHQMIGISTKAEYERLQRASDEARIQSEHTRLAFEQHVAAHRC
jgi:hypothetical protein